MIVFRVLVLNHQLFWYLSLFCVLVVLRPSVVGWKWICHRQFCKKRRFLSFCRLMMLQNCSKILPFFLLDSITLLFIILSFYLSAVWWCSRIFSRYYRFWLDNIVHFFCLLFGEDAELDITFSFLISWNWWWCRTFSRYYFFSLLIS